MTISLDGASSRRYYLLVPRSTKPVADEKSTTLQVVVSPETSQWVRDQASKEFMAVSVWVRRLIERERTAKSMKKYAKETSGG